MQGAAWISLFRRIPASHHDSMVLMTSTGAEIVLRRILRLERDLLVCQGRMAGSTDQGKLLIIPYDEIAYMSFSKKMTDGEIQAVVGKPGVAVKLVEEAPEPEGEAALETMEELASEPMEFSLESATVLEPPLPESEAETVEGAKPGPKVAPPSKSVLLARLRQRLATDIARQAEGG
jgi:hypothetical protein